MEKFQAFSRLLTTGAPAALATVGVKDAGTDTFSAIFSDNLGSPTPKVNPFTADANGYFFFYAADGRYDVTITPTSGGSAYTLGDVLLDDPAS